MALKNLFDMVKADRYTQDGREAIIKAQEAETEDKVYQIGEISQKTGLQKTANGWVKPKNGKQPGAASKHDTDPQTYIVKKNDELRKMYLNEKDPAKKEAMKKALQKQASMMESESFAPGEEAGAKTGESKSPSVGSINRTPERIKKETAIMEALNLSTGEDNNLHKMSDETIERLYKKAMSDTPAPKKENQTRTFTFNAGPDGKPVPGTGKQVQTFKTKEEAQKALNTQNAVAKYKDLPGPQRKDALFASTFEGISIGQTQNQMERQGWDLIKADDQVNVYGKPDGSKVTMKHDGKNITETNYEAPAAGSESKPAAPVKRNEIENVGGSNRPYRIKGTRLYFETPEEAETAIVAGTRGEGKTWAKPSSDPNINEIQNALGFKLDSEYAGKYSMDDFMKKTGKDEYGVRVWSFGTDSKGTLIDTFGVGSYAEPNATIKKENGEWKLHYKRDGKEKIVTANGREDRTEDAAPRQLTGDCRIRIRKEKPALTGDTKIRVRK